MAITAKLDLPRFRRKAKEQNGAGDQVLNPVEEIEERVEEEATVIAARAKADLIAYFTRKQWRLIRISSVLYVFSCIFLLLVSNPPNLFPLIPKNHAHQKFAFADRNRQHKQQARHPSQLVPENRPLRHSPLDLSLGRNARKLHRP
jgi:hypothetical protein